MIVSGYIQFVCWISNLTFVLVSVIQDTFIKEAQDKYASLQEKYDTDLSV
jgi:hypothetical protein